MRVHVLHIGKTGGSALKAALRPLDRADLVLHEHDFTLADVPEDDRAVFAVRHPVDRFVSGFYSRQRQGRPLYDVPWAAAETAAFARFHTANALAEGLGSTDTDEMNAAHQAMQAIAHTRTFLRDWLGEPEALGADTRVFAVLHQPDLDADFARLRLVLRASQARLPADALARHANGAAFDTRLSDRARAALNHWYIDDMRLYAAALALRERLHARRLAA